MAETIDRDPKALGTNRDGLLAAIRHGVIVSCQAETGSPLDAQPQQLALFGEASLRSVKQDIHLVHPTVGCRARPGKRQATPNRGHVGHAELDFDLGVARHVHLARVIGFG